eukprot:m.136963 g.136963  ORF g.136963 m.136963 type:complete len:989 (+) comp14893_c1_seq13:145-3111(+)
MDVVRAGLGLELFPPDVLLEENEVKSLDLHDNRLAAIPASITALKGTLLSLKLQQNLFTSIPAHMGQLENLQHLDLANNAITSIADELGLCQNLLYLNLAGNRLAVLPAGLLRLGHLSYLNLSNNVLTQLPTGLNALGELEELYVNENRLTELPLAIGQLQSLRILCVRANQLHGCPSLARLTHLERVDLAGNPLYAPLAAIVEQGPAAALQHLRAASVLQAHLPETPRRQLGLVVSAVTLVPTDAKAPDVYVEIEVGGDVRRTPVCRATWAPVWAAATRNTFLVQRASIVKLRVMCKRVFKDSVVAVAELPAANIPAAATGGREMDVTLEAWTPSGQSRTVAGSVRLQVALAGRPFLEHLAAAAAPTAAGGGGGAAGARASPGPSISSLSLSPAPSPATPAAAASSTALPPGWEERQTPEGRVFYVDHTTRTTHWRRPAFDPRALPALPQGWEARQTPQGRVYYVDHATRTSTWRPPTAATMAEQHRFDDSMATRLAAMRESHHRRTLTASAPRALGPLPPGWEERQTEQGRPYFVNHATRTTQWEDPRTQSGVLDVSMVPLPSGWEMRQTAEGRTFFVDHNTRTTTFSDPRLSQFDSSHPRVSRDFKYKLWIFRNKHCQPIAGTTKLIVSRNTIFQDSYAAVMAYTKGPSGLCDALRCRLFITFTGEAGLDYGGVAREWYFLLSHAMLNPMYCLFQYASNNYALQINPTSSVNPEHLQYFRFVGRILALAIFNSKFIDTAFTPVFYKQLLNKPVTLKDLEGVDTEYYNSLDWLLKNSIDDCALGLVFSTTVERFGVQEEIDLMPNGRQTEVTDANKAEYVRLMTEWRLTKSVAAQMAALRSGFEEIMPLQHLAIFDEREVELVLIGLAELDVGDWQRSAIYRNYTATSPQILWFWEVVRSWDNEKRARLLQFVTGSSRLPMGGFKELIGSNGTVQPFCIEKVGDRKMLPRSHTCFNRLDLPPYRNKAELEEKLSIAVEETEGFGLE